jgi:uncharacterized protein with von Willebrand factor type A (vWA) domain
MFLAFLDELRAAGIPASLKEHLVLLRALDEEVIDRTPEQFYYLARATYVKDEGLLDRFDQVFAKVFRGIATSFAENRAELPADWLRAVAEKHLTPEEMAAIESLGSWDEIMAALEQRLAEQEGRHQGGSKWIGTGGTSPFGNGGYNPEGVRIGGESRHGKAIKVWDQRAFKNLDSTRELGTRNIKVALRLARRPAAAGAAQRGQAAAVSRRRRIDGSVGDVVRGDVFRRDGRVQEPRILLLSQLPVRGAVERQPPPFHRADADLGCPPQVRPRL